MNYLNPTFSVKSPDTTEGLSCPRCVFGPKWGEHVKDCPQQREACQECGGLINPVLMAGHRFAAHDIPHE